VAGFALARSKATVGFSADADPNTTPPAVADVIDIPGSKSGGRASDTHLIVQFVDAAGFVAGGTVTASIWIKDATSGKFIDSGKSITTKAPLLLEELGILFDGPVFFQITAIADPGSTTNVQILVKVV